MDRLLIKLRDLLLENKSSECIKLIEDDLNRCKYPYELFNIECGYGWYGIILPIIYKIEEYNKTNLDSPIVIQQIKEKFGGLRFYVDNAPNYIMDMIDKAEDLSYYICEKCGSCIDVTTEGRGWIKTLCKECRKN